MIGAPGFLTPDQFKKLKKVDTGQLLNQTAQIFLDDVKIFKAFIDSHPDYLLILSSDHGIDEFTQVHQIIFQIG